MVAADEQSSAAPHLQLWSPNRLHETATLGRLPGLTRARLIEAEDGQRYVLKDLVNPCGRRVLVNEVLAAALEWHLGLPHPPTAFIRPATDVGAAPWGFGSRVLPGCAVSQPLPRRAWLEAAIRRLLLGVFVFDVWCGNADRRQLLVQRLSPLRIWMIDNGHCFGGPAWRRLAQLIPCKDSPAAPYIAHVAWGEVEYWIRKIRAIPSAEILGLAALVPPEWLDGNDRLELAELLRELDLMRGPLRESIAIYFADLGCARSRPHAFFGYPDHDTPRNAAA